MTRFGTSPNMGSGASAEQQQPMGQTGSSRLHSRDPSPINMRGINPVPPSVANRPMSRGPGGHATSSLSLRSTLRGTASMTTTNTSIRKVRAAALGRRSAFTVTLGKMGFSIQRLHICEGQVVTFVWNETDGPGFNITQVTFDGEQYRPVPGGFNSGPVSKKGFYEQQLNLKGEYKFVSAGIKCTPLTVLVDPRAAIEAELTDYGFEPKTIRVDEGNSIQWMWDNCGISHSIYEVKYNPRSGTFIKPDGTEEGIATKAGSYKHNFPKPGMYYFQSEGATAGVFNTCVVHVRERQREYSIDVLDRSFNPSIIVIEEGDRLWWRWDKENCNNHHCIYQVDIPALNSNDDSLKPTKNGFKWPTPTKSGVLSAEFFQAGVYYYSDHDFQSAAEYLGTIIVRPKQVEHFVEISPEGFQPDLLYAETGDRIWWTWTCADMDPAFMIKEVDRCVSPLGRRPALEAPDEGEMSYMDEGTKEQLVTVGLGTTTLGSIGVIHFGIGNSQAALSTCSVISNAGPKNHTVHVTDSGFEPKVITIHPGDRVWWVWQEGSKQHNILQVTHGGSQIAGGFSSGIPLDTPSAYQHQFDNTGVYYYISNSIGKAFGAVVVTTQPEVHEVHVNPNVITPDPVLGNLNDVVAWTFKGLRQVNIKEVKSLSEVRESQGGGKAITPRRCLNQVFTKKGIFHYSSKSFMRQGKKDRQSDDGRVSTVIIEESCDSAMVRVDAAGFHPKEITIEKGESVLWSWKESGDEPHNIIHVQSSDSKAPLSVIEGGQSFNSGKPVARNSFLYTFDEPGIYTVASQGAPGFAGITHVLEKGACRVSPPYIISGERGGHVDQMSMVKLTTDTPGATIYYTVDGMTPALHNSAPKQYKPDKGIVLREPGYHFIRAMAVCEDHLNSHIFTSRRYWVSGDRKEESSSSEEEVSPRDDGKMRLWQMCVPTIKGCFMSPGVMEIFWEHPPTEAMGLIRGYQIYLNDISYCQMFPPNHNSVNIAGMAGDRLYEVVLETYPYDSMYLPHRSNKLVMKCVKTTSTGGPVISLEIPSKADTMAIVWMSISTPEEPITGYRLYLNGQLCGNQIVPDEQSDRCKVVIEGCKLNSLYRVVVTAIPKGDGKPKMSNELEVSLPLETEFIRLPTSRPGDADMYKEYIEIREGSGYLPEMDGHITHRSYLSLTGKAAGNKSVRIHTDNLVDNAQSRPNQRQRLPTPVPVVKVDSYDKDEDYSEVEVDDMHNQSYDQHGYGYSESEEEQVYEDQHGYHDDREQGYYEAEESGSDLDSDADAGPDGRSYMMPVPPAQQQSGLLQVPTFGMTPQMPERSASPPPKPWIPQERRSSLEKLGIITFHEPPPVHIQPPADNDTPISGAVRQQSSHLSYDPPLLTNRPEPKTLNLPHKQVGHMLPEPPAVPKAPPGGYSKKVVMRTSSLASSHEYSNSEGRDDYQHPYGLKLVSQQTMDEETEVYSVEVDTADPYHSYARRGVHQQDSREDGHAMEETVEGSHCQVEVSPDVYLDRRTPRPKSRLPSGDYKRRRKGPRTAVVEVQDGDLSVKATETHVTAAVPVLGQPRDDEHLPVPRVRAENRGNDSALISWDLPRTPDPQYRLLVYVVNVIGRAFDTNVNSDISFECLQEEGGEQTAAVQHCWNITKGKECFVKGLKPGLKYKIFVVANYSLVRGQQPCEIQAASDPIIYTTLGPPAPPKLKVINADLYRATVEWEKGESHHEVVVTGFRVLVDGKQLGEVQSRTTNQTIIDNLQPGRTIRVQVVACTSHVVGDSEPSKPVQVTCPPRPQAPTLSQQPSYRAGAVIIGWERPLVQQSTSVPEDIVLYKIFLDGKPYGEVKASVASNKNGYQYCLASLNAGQVYDVSVQSVAGQRQVEPGANHILCLCESEMSSSLPVQCAAPPTSPMLRVEGLHDKGIDITWDMPQQYGDAAVSGFQLLKDGRLYGSIMPPDVHNLRIKDVDLGNKVMLQILALTDHPVGRQDPEPSKDGKADLRPGESGFAEVFVGDRYSACKPGPKLVVNFTGLVQAPSRVWCEQVTGHSALVVWSTGDRLKPHFVPPESYQVTWWQVTRDDIQSQSTTGDHLLITGLKPNTSYNVVVEARRMQNYEQVPGESRFGEDVINTFIITSKSERLSFQTAKPPAPPTNLGVLATTCHSVQLAWDPPEVYGVDVIGIRLDAVPLKSIHGKHILEEVMPDRTTGILNGLSENTEYLVTVTAITEEYFEQLSEGDPIRRSRSLSRNRVPDEHAWLPSSTIIVMTSGTEPPCEVKVREATVNSVLIAWKPAVVHGSNRLQSTIVRWAEAKHKTAREDASLAHHNTLVADSNEMNIENLTPGVLYRVVVEAVVSVKTALDGKRQEPEEEKRNRRTTHVMSQPLYVRTRAPCEPPKPIITAYTASTINLYWEKPLLYQVIGKEADGTPKYLKLSLEGYRLEINGKPHMRLVSTAQSCTLVKCRPGKTYSVVLVALTCTDDVKRERRRKFRGNSSVTSLGSHSWNTTSEDEENDESPSAPVEVTIPTHTTGALSECCALYESPHTNNIHAVGDIHAEWSVIGNAAHIDQFDVTWLCLENKELQKRMVDNKTNFTKVPPLKQRSIYDVTVESQLNTDAVEPLVQKVQVLIPGPPDAPEIWTRSIEKEEFTIEWGEPRLWGVKIRGYQVYLNGRRVGNELNANHRRAIIPCKPRRSYKVNMVALSADAQYADSEKSNTLLISTGGGGGDAPYIDGTSTNLGEDRARVPVDDADRREIPVRVVKVTDSEIHLDWSLYQAVEGIWNYRIQWSSVAQQSEREVKFPAAEKSCIIHKCYPGTNHFIRLLAMSEDDQVLDQSGQLIIQTCAPPDTPVVTLRSCNFRYVTIQWEKPSVYGDALITGYKVYVNGVVEAILGPDQHTYTYSNGKWCREYSFQVQALTGVDTWNSKPSEPLVVTWPGLQPPVLRRAPSISGNSVKIVWDKPSSTDGVKIKQYKALCTDNDTGKVVQVISPIHPDTTEAEFHNLRTGTYMLHLDVFLHGSDEIIKSDVLTFTPTLTPDPPHVNVNVIGLEERRQIEKITCDLINKRDRLLNEIASSGSLSPRHTNEQAKNKATENLAQVETMLDDCLEALHHYTGHLLAHVSWTCPQSNPDIHIMGFKVLVDGQQYGTTLHNGIKNVRLKLGLNKASHRLSMVAVGDNHQATSTESNVVELLTEPFLPFSFFSYLESGPSPGAAPFEDTLSQERGHAGRKPLNQMLQKRKVPPPSCTVVDVFDGELRPLFQPSGPAAPTAMLFWSRWNHSSMKALSWFVRFARENKEQYDFVAVACGSGGLGGVEKQELVHVITDNGWRDDSSIRHITSQSAALSTMGEQVVHQREGYISQNRAKECLHDCKWKKDGGVKHRFEEITDLFGVSGVPMLIVIHPDDYIAWKGRYCAIDYTSYDSFLRHTFAKVLGLSSPGPDPFDTKISAESHDITDVCRVDIVHRRMQSESQMLIHRPMSSTSPGQTIIHTPSYPAVNGHSRPDSAHTRFFIKTNKHKNGHKRAKSATISVSSRPFSASQMYGIKSPYEQRLVNTYSPSIKSDGSARRLRSAKKLKYIS